jgi:hypothetical protein
MPGGGIAAQSGTSVATALAAGLAGIVRDPYGPSTGSRLVDAILAQLKNSDEPVANQLRKATLHISQRRTVDTRAVVFERFERDPQVSIDLDDGPDSSEKPSIPEGIRRRRIRGVGSSDFNFAPLRRV